MLHERYPQLRRTLPRITLGTGPTPVRRLEGLEEALDGRLELWLKDDSRYAEPWGGNKPRKLEWVLGHALRRGRRTIVTAGGLATNHGLATAVYARRHGLRVVLLLVDQPRDEHVEAQLRRIHASGATVWHTRTTPRTALAVPLALLRHRRATWLPVGGSSPLGCVGFVQAALELAEQVREGRLPEPERIVVALGSGGTAAGLLCGLRLAGLRSRVVAIQVNDRTPLGPGRIARLAGRTGKLLRDRGAAVADTRFRAEDLDVERGWLGGGYGHRTPEADRAIAAGRERAGLELEPVYTAKAMAAVLDLGAAGRLGRGPVLYWHTHSAQPAAPESSAPRPPT